MLIKIENLKPNNYNPREIFRGAAMEELKASIKDQGLIHPILVRPLKNNSYEVVAGMRRYYAMKELEFEEIECHVRKLNDFEAILLAYIENIQRENLTPIETGRMYQSLIDRLPSNGTKNRQNLTISKEQKIKRIVNKMNVSVSSVKNYISLLDLPKAIQNSIEANFHNNKEGFPMSYGFELARLSNNFSEDDIIKFYNLYYTDPDTRLSIENFKKKISEKIKDFDLEDKEKLEKQQLQIKKIQIERTQSQKAKERLEEQINNMMEDVSKKLGKTFETTLEIYEYIKEEITKNKPNNRYEEIHLKIQELESKDADLKVLLSRVKKENIRICPYCLAGIDLKIIEKRDNETLEQIEVLKIEQSKISSLLSYYGDVKKTLDNLLQGLEKQERIIEKLNEQLEGIKNEQ